MEQNDTYIYDGMNAFEREVKRWFDFFAALLCLIVFSPLFLVCYLAIKRDDGGPVIYKQIRLGRFGRPFYIYKFRSMRTDAENEGPQLWNSETDDRLTKAGKFLRDHHLDELPQFWNVLKGDMSIVGPRPERKHYIDLITERVPAYALLHQVRPGITSMGMVKFGYAKNVDEMVERVKYDLMYLDNMSLLNDLKILIYTIKIVFTGRGM